MMTSLQTAYCDTTARELSWQFGLDPIDALATLDVPLAGFDIQLRILGSSHQVMVDAPAGHWSETVACLPGREGGLPAAATREAGDWSYRFAAEVLAVDEVTFRTRVGCLLAGIDGHPRGIIGTFPGSELAVTALLLDPVVPSGVQRGAATGSGLGWSTWHSYPQCGEIVATRTRLVPTGSRRRHGHAPAECSGTEPHGVAAAALVPLGR